MLHKPWFAQEVSQLPHLLSLTPRRLEIFTQTGTVCGVVSERVYVCVYVCNKYFIIDKPRLPLLKVVGEKKPTLRK